MATQFLGSVAVRQEHDATVQRLTQAIHDWLLRDAPELDAAIRAFETRGVSSSNLNVIAHDEATFAANYAHARERLVEFCARCADDFAASQAQKRQNENEIAGLISRFGSRDEENVKQTYARLSELAPDRIAEWDKLLASWQKEDAKRQEQSAREAIERAAEGARAQLYADAYQDYHTARAKVRRANARAHREAQKVFDRPYTVMLVEYGITTEPNERGVADTRFVWCMGRGPDHAGYWKVIDDHGRVAERRLTHIASRGRPCVVHASTANDGVRRIFYSLSGITLYVPPGTTDEEIQAQLKLQDEPLPPQEPPLRYQTAWSIRNHIDVERDEKEREHAAETQ